AVSSAWVRRRRRGGDRGRWLRIDAAQAALPPALPREHSLRIRVRALLRRVERRTDADARGARRYECHLDGGNHRRGACPEDPACKGPSRCAACARNRRVRYLDLRCTRISARTIPNDVKERKMTSHKTASRDEWLAARMDLLVAEKELTRRSDEVARQ